MKKFLSLAAVLVALTMTVTACSNGDDTSGAGTSTSEAGTSSGTNSDAENAGSSTAEAAPDNGEQTAEDGEQAPNEGEQTPEAGVLSAADMAANAFAAGEWPALMEISDVETADMLFGIDISMLEDYVLYAPMMSAHINEVIIVKPTAGNEAAVKEALDAHFAYIKESAAFYPDQEITAAASVQGEANGYLYVIVHDDGATIAASLLNNPPASSDAAAGEDAAVASQALVYGEAAAAAAEWPAMMTVDDPELALNFFGIDINLCSDYYISNQLISAQLYEIIFVKPVEGCEQMIMDQMQAHFDYIKTDAAFYPDQEPCAEGAVMGQTADGYMYILVHQDGSTVEAAVMAANG